MLITMSDQLVHTNMDYFCVSRPRKVARKVDGQELYDCVEDSLCRLGVQGIDSEKCKMLIGIGTDGASANIAVAGLGYQAVWWKLFHSPNVSDCTNALKLAWLFFSLPVSNGKLERVFQ